ncbi:hypothetical protein [Aeromonas jandaei]|uniref:hypothetical protein n=1 Tax=Aeromonas jandaei TaxID=650 RepID=UPI0013FD6166|nr:hypothetical protein [Aeromonas jandaei]
MNRGFQVQASCTLGSFMVGFEPTLIRINIHIAAILFVVGGGCSMAITGGLCVALGRMV